MLGAAGVDIRGDMTGEGVRTAMVLGGGEGGDGKQSKNVKGRHGLMLEGEGEGEGEGEEKEFCFIFTMRYALQLNLRVEADRLSFVQLMCLIAIRRNLGWNRASPSAIEHVSRR